MNLCCCAEDNALAERLRRLTTAAGWNCWICRRPEDFSLFLAGLAEPVDLILSDSPLAAERLSGEHAPAKATPCACIGSASDQFPEAWHRLTPASDDELKQQLFNLLSVARLSATEMNPNEYEPVTGFAYLGAFRAQLAELNDQYTLVCLELCHGTYLFDALDPLARTDLLASLASELRTRLPLSTPLGFDSPSRFFAAFATRERQEVEAQLDALLGSSDIVVHYRTGVAQLRFLAGACEALEDLDKTAIVCTDLVTQASGDMPLVWASEWTSEAVGTKAAGTPVATGRRLCHALDRNEFSIMLQPQWSLTAGPVPGQALNGAEALLRWQGMDVGTLAPDQFIPAAERSGAMTRIGDWVLDAVATTSRTWLETRLDPIFISVNVSASQFKGDSLQQRILRLIRKDWLDATHLELELQAPALERLLHDDRQLVFALKDMGVRLALDNVGASPIDPARLLRLPVDTIKFDRRLVAGLTTDANAERLVDKLIQLAERYRLRTVAVGVEQEAQLDRLITLGCQEAQGYLLAEPLPVDAFEALLAQRYWDKRASR